VIFILIRLAFLSANLGAQEVIGMAASRAIDWLEMNRFHGRESRR
jgi:hypothetical protein